MQLSYCDFYARQACNFTKINTPSWVFFTFFKLYKWYQIVQHITNIIHHFCCGESKLFENVPKFQNIMFLIVELISNIVHVILN